MAEEEDLVEAAKANDLARVSGIASRNPALLRQRGGPGTAALAAVIAAGNIAIVDYLLRKEVKLDIYTASALGRSVDVEAMLAANHDYAWDFSEDGVTALHLAAEYGHPECVAQLIRGISDVNAKVRDGAKSMPLHLAAKNGHVRVAQQLVAAGADVNGKDANGKTPVGIALEAGQSEMVAYLQSEGGVEVVVAPPPKAAKAAPAASATGAPAEAVNPLTGKPVKGTIRAIEAINKSRAKRGLEPLPLPTAAAAPAAAAGVAGADAETNPLTGKPTAATDRAREAINRSRAKRGLPPLEGPEPVAAAPAEGAPTADAPAAATAGDADPATGKPTAGSNRAKEAINRSRAKRGLPPLE